MTLTLAFRSQTTHTAKIRIIRLDPGLHLGFQFFQNVFQSSPKCKQIIDYSSANCFLKLFYVNNYSQIKDDKTQLESSNSRPCTI
jgi:hypothetical protein